MFSEGFIDLGSFAKSDHLCILKINQAIWNQIALQEFSFIIWSKRICQFGRFWEIRCPFVEKEFHRLCLRCTCWILWQYNEQTIPRIWKILILVSLWHYFQRPVGVRWSGLYIQISNFDGRHDHSMFSFWEIAVNLKIFLDPVKNVLLSENVCWF